MKLCYQRKEKKINSSTTKEKKDNIIIFNEREEKKEVSCGWLKPVCTTHKYASERQRTR